MKHRRKGRKEQVGPHAAPAGGAPLSLRNIVTTIGLVVITFLVYGGATGNGLLNWDDNEYITDNPYLKDLSWPGIKGILSAYLVGNYHPLTLLSYALEYAWAGRVDVVLMHTTNVVFHIANTALVFLLGKRLLNDHWGGVIVALLFALHPMHVESVAWIAERKDVLYTFFFLLSLLVYLRYVKTEGAGAYVLCLLLFGLSLLSKSAAAAMAPLLFVVDHWIGRAWSWKLVLEKLPFFALAIGVGIVALSSQSGAMDESFAPHFPWWQRPFIMGHALAFYLVHFVFPYGLSAIHPYPIEPGASIAPLIGPTIGVVLVLGTTLWFAYRSRTYWKVTVTGTLFFVITLAMVLQLIPVGRAIVAERYTYVPYIGLSMIVARLVVDAWRSGAGRSRNMRYVPAGVLIVALLAFSMITKDRISVWKTSFTLFADMLENYPEDGLTHYNRGLTNYYARNYAASIADYDACVKYKPDCAPCYFNRGLSYKELGDMEAVIRDMDMAIQYKDAYTDAYRNRGNAKAILHDYPGSIADFSIALSLSPNDTSVWMNRGLSYHFSQRPDSACADWSKASSLGGRKAADLVRDNCGSTP
ncbi:MAG: glycosyltransferase family 39 protein [Flavobacteriales bacterium]|nr:glycosyltransferase family 39 protein [Flavobacteriales bacterium]